MSHIRLKYKPEDEWHGAVEVVAQTSTFSGRGSAYFSLEVMREFSERLKIYPLSEEAPPKIESGFGSPSEALKQIHVGLTIQPYSSSGKLLVVVELASEVWSTPNIDLQQQLRTRFLTEYWAITEFQESLDRTLGGNGEAFLQGL
ncbi:hypothetical protein MHY87_07605 [Microvirga sp. ACRRW]|uniref:hypothetical protein n=1 Tax=Microvirga sp. ACRRW TaxID=2918205 RepID=UPI001EF5F549|nr:hypothetical protein [Microvirga sp. ACRRW]MCG7392767.1 hypothetical protein [Microvirga sp. ACRRW]